VVGGVGRGRRRGGTSCIRVGGPRGAVSERCGCFCREGERAGGRKVWTCEGTFLGSDGGDGVDWG